MKALICVLAAAGGFGWGYQWYVIYNDWGNVPYWASAVDLLGQAMPHVGGVSGVLNYFL